MHYYHVILDLMVVCFYGTYLLQNHLVDMNVKCGEQQCGSDDRTEVKEHEVFRSHYLKEETFIGMFMPPHQWQKANHTSTEPTNTDYH